MAQKASVTDSGPHGEIRQLVEEITHSGQKILDDSKMKKLKSICKQSDSFIEHLQFSIMHYMEKEHAEIRFSAFQLCDEFFRRSHTFRELTIASLPRIFELTVGANSARRLPPPLKVAADLKKMVLKTVKEWNSTYGKAYKKLTLGYNYLKKCEKVNFDALEMEDSLTQARNRRIESKKKLAEESKLIKVRSEISEHEHDIKMAVNALSACLNLLVPSLNDFICDDGDEEGPSEDKPSTSAEGAPSNQVEEEVFVEENETNLEFRERGISSKYSIEISINPGKGPTIIENPENSAVIENAVDQYKLLKNRSLPLIKKWLQTFSKIGKEEEVKKIVDLKMEVELLINKFQMLEIVKMRRENEVSTDSELEDVPIDETLALCPEGDEEIAASGSKISPKHQNIVSHNNKSAEKAGSSPSKSSTTGTSSPNAKIKDESEPVRWECRALLPNGQLCPRRDRLKCPFHGKIVGRDKTGRCSNIEDEMKAQEKREKEQQERPDWQDPTLLAELKAATGVDLKMPEKTKNGRRKRRVEKKYPGLTDLKEAQNTCFNRLSKKVFKRSTLKRVARSLDKLDFRRFRHKFGDQFNYMYDA